MTKSTFARFAAVAGGLLALWLGLRYALPLAFPFLLGTLAALAAEPGVRFLQGKLGLRRWMAAAVGVTGVLVGLLALGALLIALAVREAGQLTAVLPDLSESVRQGMGALEGWLLTLSSSAPQSLRRALSQGVTGFFSDSSALMEQVTQRLLKMASGFLGGLTRGALVFFTGVISAYMISVRFPDIRRFLRERLPEGVRQKYLPALKGLRSTLTGWLSAQFKLMLITMAVLCVGFLLLRIPYAPVCAVVVSFVDALPVLGSGIVLLPWSLISLLQGQRLQSLGLLGLYAVVWLVRSTLEPRLLGKELGLDPLVTLIAVYVGFQLLGLPGMLLCPLLAVAITRLGSTFSSKKD